MQNAAAGAVLIVNITAHDDAQALDIKERVFDLQRIEGPFDQLDVAVQRPLALFEFKAAADAGVAIVRQHAQHVAMNVILAAGFEAGNAKAEGDHFVFGESAKDLAADFIGHDEQALREKFDIVIAPDLALQAHDGAEVFQLIELANFDLRHFAAPLNRVGQALSPAKADREARPTNVQTVPLLISSARCSDARMDSARIVMVGFCQPAVTKLAPSTTNRFLMS